MIGLVAFFKIRDRTSLQTFKDHNTCQSCSTPARLTINVHYASRDGQFHSNEALMTR